MPHRLAPTSPPPPCVCVCVCVCVCRGLGGGAVPPTHRGATTLCMLSDFLDVVSSIHYIIIIMGPGVPSSQSCTGDGSVTWWDQLLLFAERMANEMSWYTPYEQGIVCSLSSTRSHAFRRELANVYHPSFSWPKGPLWRITSLSHVELTSERTGNRPHCTGSLDEGQFRLPADANRAAVSVPEIARSINGVSSAAQKQLSGHSSFWSECASLVQFSSVKDGIYALGISHMRFTPSLRSF